MKIFVATSVASVGALSFGKGKAEKFLASSNSKRFPNGIFFHTKDEEDDFEKYYNDNVAGQDKKEFMKVCSQKCPDHNDDAVPSAEECKEQICPFLWNCVGDAEKAGDFEKLIGCIEGMHGEQGDETEEEMHDTEEGDDEVQLHGEKPKPKEKAAGSKPKPKAEAGSKPKPESFLAVPKPKPDGPKPGTGQKPKPKEAGSEPESFLAVPKPKPDGPKPGTGEHHISMKHKKMAQKVLKAHLKDDGFEEKYDAEVKGKHEDVFMDVCAKECPDHAEDGFPGVAECQDEICPLLWDCVSGGAESAGDFGALMNCVGELHDEQEEEVEEEFHGEEPAEPAP